MPSRETKKKKQQRNHGRSWGAKSGVTPREAHQLGLPAQQPEKKVEKASVEASSGIQDDPRPVWIPGKNMLPLSRGPISPLSYSVFLTLTKENFPLDRGASAFMYCDLSILI